MEKIKITFLGTGSSVPTPKRSHPAILLSYKNETFLFDCGEGTQTQIRKAHISPSKITKIFLTHRHGDHIFGLPGLMQTLAMSDYNKPLEIYCPKQTKHYLKNFQNLLGENKISLDIKEISKTSKPIIETDEFKVEAKEMKHSCPVLGYSFIIKEKTRIDKSKLKKLNISNHPDLKLLLKGKRVKINGKTLSPKQLTYKEPERKVTIILDTAKNSNIQKLTKNSDLLIIESSFLEEEKQKAKESLHLTAKQAAQAAKKAKTKRLILTHLSQRYEKNPELVLDEAKKEFKNVSLANDLEQLQI